MAAIPHGNRRAVPTEGIDCAAAVIGRPSPSGVPQRWQKRAFVESVVPQAAQKTPRGAGSDGGSAPGLFDVDMAGEYYRSVERYGTLDAVATIRRSLTFAQIPCPLPIDRSCLRT